MNNILVIGGGGREHAIAWKLAQSQQVKKVFVAPGNAGTAKEGPTIENVNINFKYHNQISSWCQQEQISVVVVGPEAPLAEGIADELRTKKILCFGPSKLAARIEWDKCYAKKLMDDFGIPTASWASFTDIQAAFHHLRSVDYHTYVVKANGLAGGKGAVICKTIKEAENAIIDVLKNGRFGGSKIIIEEYLEGEEISVLAFCDGKSVSVMPYAHDYKRLEDGDNGPNTGGMGAYVPYNQISSEVNEFIKYGIMQKIVSIMQQRGHPFVGVLYAGIMLTLSGPRILEFNCRFGDPEAQVLLPLLRSDLYQIIADCLHCKLNSESIQWYQDTIVGVIIASDGYPLQYKKNCLIRDVNPTSALKDVKIFHGATTLMPASKSDQLFTCGGRVITVTGRASNIRLARYKAYEGVASIHFDGKIFRNDIASKPKCDRKRAIGLSYKDCGVDIDAGNKFVDIINSITRPTARAGCSEEIGGFAAALNCTAAGYHNPFVIMTTDGVGTKSVICQEMKHHETIGIDLVAMCVNDVLARGAEVIAFLDYVSYSKLERHVMKTVIQGIAHGCKLAGCALVGGETAEMPGLYTAGYYDLAGFAVGLVNQDNLLPRLDTIASGDVVIGIASSGIHSNGFSLVRQLIRQKQLTYDMPVPFSVPDRDSESAAISLGQVLLRPTAIYCKSLLPALRSGYVKAYAHITGGGLVENISRILPKKCRAVLDARNWEIHGIFKWIAVEGNVKDDEMIRVFNCGIGAVLICSQKNQEYVMKLLENSEYKHWTIGEIHSSNNHNKKVELEWFRSALMVGDDKELMQDTNRSIHVRNTVRVAILISGCGTNLQAIIDHTKATNSRAKVVLVISNVAKVKGLERAKNSNTESLVIDDKKYNNRHEFENAIHDALIERSIELVCLAGFMRILTDNFVNKWKGKLLNTHPSLLPLFAGNRAVQRALEAGVRITGCTVHFVEVQVDEGPIIAQEAVAIKPDDTVETLTERIKRVEHSCYPRAIDMVVNGQIKYAHGKVVWK